MKVKHSFLTKYSLLQIAESSLYDPVEKEFDEAIKDLLRINNSLLPPEKRSSNFYFDGVRYPTLPYYKDQGVLLDETLTEKAAKVIADYWVICNSEKPLVLNYLRKIVNHTLEVKDVLLLLPSCLHAPIKNEFPSADFTGARLSAEEVRVLVGASERGMQLFSVRMMSNLIGG